MSQHNWPTGSMRRALDENFGGAQSPREALENLIKKRSLNERPEAGPHETRISKSRMMSDYEAMSWSIKEIERRLDGMNLDLMDQERRKELAEMPLRTREDLRKWTQGWFAEIDRAKGVR